MLGGNCSGLRFDRVGQRAAIGSRYILDSFALLDIAACQIHIDYRGGRGRVSAGRCGQLCALCWAAAAVIGIH